MTKPVQQPGHGRSTSEAAFAEVTKEIARRNERAQREAQKLRAEREQAQARRRRQDDLR
ncbi:MAG: hypothetical protein ACLP50_11640 [Solirubrobacteraceae bacterium]